jgi:hypothetical protein
VHGISLFVILLLKEVICQFLLLKEVIYHVGNTRGVTISMSSYMKRDIWGDTSYVSHAINVPFYLYYLLQISLFSSFWRFVGLLIGSM